MKNNDPIIITKSIELGILLSTNLMTIISEKTKDSWWVPYEVGFVKSKEINLSTLKLKDVIYIPSLLQITNILKRVKALDNYLNLIKHNGVATPFSKAQILNESIQYLHPLKMYLSTTE